MSEPEKILDHKWLSPKCIEHGCQSLVLSGQYEAAVKGRAGFRAAYRKARDERDALRKAIAAYIEALDAEPLSDCWDTESGKEEIGAQKFASDWAWEDYHEKVRQALGRLRAALAQPQTTKRASSPPLAHQPRMTNDPE